jgi:hypothetical protein
MTSRHLSLVNYGHEKLMLATLSLAQGDKRLPERLGDAYVYHLIHIRPENLPSDALRQELKAIGDRLTQIPDDQRGSVAASVESMTWEEALPIAEKIVSMFITVHDWINGID